MSYSTDGVLVRATSPLVQMIIFSMSSYDVRKRNRRYYSVVNERIKEKEDLNGFR